MNFYIMSGNAAAGRQGNKLEHCACSRHEHM